MHRRGTYVCVLVAYIFFGACKPKPLIINEENLFSICDEDLTLENIKSDTAFQRTDEINGLIKQINPEMSITFWFDVERKLVYSQWVEIFTPKFSEESLDSARYKHDLYLLGSMCFQEEEQWSNEYSNGVTITPRAYRFTARSPHTGLPYFCTFSEEADGKGRLFIQNYLKVYYLINNKKDIK